MKISIALCTYNGENFLREQLDSIAQQTRLPDELVVCDDRSKDGTLGILETFRDRGSFPVNIYQNEENLGSTKNFEKAIGLCTGEIIVLCDQDDVWKPHKLERQEEVLLANPEAGYAFSNAELVDEHLQQLGNLLWDSVGFKGEIKESFLKGDQYRCFIKKDIVTGATLAFRKSLGVIAMPFPKSGRWIHDGWIVLIASSIGVLGAPIEEPLIEYRLHSAQQIGAPATSTATAEKDGGTKRKSLLEMYRELKNNEKYLFEQWEKHGLQILSVIPSLKDKLSEIGKTSHSVKLEDNLQFLKEFETHFLNRRKILTSRNISRYRLILQEAFSGRYGQFSDSWRSMFRDLFL